MDQQMKNNDEYPTNFDKVLQIKPSHFFGILQAHLFDKFLLVFHKLVSFVLIQVIPYCHPYETDEDTKCFLFWLDQQWH